MKPTWRMLLRIAVFQSVVASLGALIVLALFHLKAASAFFVGVALVIIATLVAAVLGLRRAGSPFDSLAKVLGAIFSKWLLISVVMYLAITRWQLAALPFMLGVLTAQLSALLAGIRQPKY